MSCQPDESVERDAGRDEHANGPGSRLGEPAHNRQNVWRGARQYFIRPENVISLLTLATVVVYTSLTYCLLNTERESYTRVQRAFVFPAEYVFRMERADRRVSINAVWKNGGDTPTRNLHISITEALRRAPLPADFDFSSDDRNAYGGRPLPILVLGPHASVSGIRSAEIPLSAVSDINNGRASVFLWGYASYDDVFGSPHVTRYCVQITSIEADPSGSTSDVTGTYIPCDRGNCADEECTTEKIPLPDHQETRTAGATP